MRPVKLPKIPIRDPDANPRRAFAEIPGMVRCVMKKGSLRADAGIHQARCAPLRLHFTLPGGGSMGARCV